VTPDGVAAWLRSQDQETLGEVIEALSGAARDSHMGAFYGVWLSAYISEITQLFHLVLAGEEGAAEEAYRFLAQPLFPTVGSFEEGRIAHLEAAIIAKDEALRACQVAIAFDPEVLERKIERALNQRPNVEGLLLRQDRRCRELQVELEDLRASYRELNEIKCLLESRYARERLENQRD